MKKYYYTYKITLTQGSLKGKFYFGKHSTTNLNDNYKGSGAIIKQYYKKYPKGYIKEILAYYNSEEELNKAEKDIIIKYIKNENCLNIHLGGNGGDTYTYQPEERKQEINNKRSASLKGKNKGKHCPEYQKQYLSEINKGKTKSEECKQKIRQRMLGEGNPMYGKATYGFKDKNHSKETKQLLSKKKIEYRKNNPEQAYENCAKGGRKMKGKHRVYDNPERTKWHMAY